MGHGNGRLRNDTRVLGMCGEGEKVEAGLRLKVGTERYAVKAVCSCEKDSRLSRTSFPC